MDAPITAHFDGQSIVPDEPVPFAAGQRLVVGSAPSADTLPVEFRDGNIRLTGSRISLSLFLDEFFKGRSAEALASRFSTIDPQQITELIAFVEAHEPLLRMYHAAEQWREEHLCLPERQGPSLETLKQRAKERGIKLSE